MPPPQSYVSNIPLSVAAALRYIDANGVEVSKLFPNDYLSLTGSATGTLKTQYQQVVQILSQYNTRITILETEVAAILTSGATNMPYVNGQCLYNDNILHPVDDAFNRLALSYCNYVNVLGTPTALASSIVLQTASVLNALPAFSQNSAMSGLANWSSVPTTIAASFGDLWLAYLDARTGISTALAAVTPTCAQVIVNYQAVMNNFYAGMYMYFNGYSFIPTGYADNGSTIQITDGIGGVLLQSFNILTQSTASVPLVLNTSGSTLSPTVISYQVAVNSNIKNNALNIVCQKTMVSTVSNPYSSSSTRVLGGDFGNFSLMTSGNTSATYILTNNLNYTPRFASVTPKNGATGQLFVNTGGYNLIYLATGLQIVFASSISFVGLINIDFITYK